MIRFTITHTTEYKYTSPASLSYNEARMVPRSFSTPLFNQNCLTHQVSTAPIWRDHSLRQDYFGNSVLYFTVREPHSEMGITISSEVKVTPSADNPQDRSSYENWALNSPSWEMVADRLKTDSSSELLAAREFTIDSPLASAFGGAYEYSARAFTPKRPILAATRDLMQQIFEEFEYKPGATSIYTSIGQVYATKSGVCQDFAHFMLACLRSRGLAARYMSGYIETLPRPGQEKLQGADASHAWVSVYVPEMGWVDFDPTNDLIPHVQHITLAWGRDFTDVTPLKGIFFGGGEHKLVVAVDVRRSQ